MKQVKHHRLEKWRWVSILILIGLLAHFLLSGINQAEVVAQDGELSSLTETYQLETDHGTLLVNYPEGWTADGVGPSDIPYVALHNQSIIESALPTMMAQIVVIDAEDLPIAFDLNAEHLSSTYFEAFKAIRLEENRGAYGNVVPVQFGNGELAYDGALMMLFETNYGAFLQAETKMSIGLSAELDDDVLLIIEFQASADIFDDTLPLWFSMIDTLVWNGVGLTNVEVRDIYEGLENTEALRQTYLESQDQQGESSNTNIQDFDWSNKLSLQAGEREVAVPRPIGWVENSREDETLVRFESPDDSTTFLEVHWLEADGELLSSPMAIILGQIALESGYEILDINVFSLDGMPSVGVSYRLDDGNVGIRFGVSLPEDGGLLDIRLQSPQSNWLTLQGTTFGVFSGITIDDMRVNFSVILQAYQSLRNPSIQN